MLRKKALALSGHQIIKQVDSVCLFKFLYKIMLVYTNLS